MAALAAPIRTPVPVLVAVPAPASLPEQPSMFCTAFPYAVCSLAVGAAAATAAILCASVAAKVTAIVIAVMAVYAFLGIVLGAIAHKGDPEAFKANLCAIVATAAGTAMASLIEQVARTAFQVLIESLLGIRR